MADKLELETEGSPILSLLERVAGIIDDVQARQQRMEERQLELETNVKSIQADVQKLSSAHTATSSTVDQLLTKTRKVSTSIKDVRVRLEQQNLRVKKVEATQGELLVKNKFRVVIYQGDNEVPAKAAGFEGASGDAAERSSLEPSAPLPPADVSEDEEYMVVEEASSSTAGRLKKTGLKRIESLKATFSRENITKRKESFGTKVQNLGERIVTAERREKIRQSGERLKESIAKNVPAKLKKERTVAEGQEGAEGASERAAPVPPPKGRKMSPDKTHTDVGKESKEVTEGGKGEESEVPMYDMKQLS